MADRPKVCIDRVLPTEFMRPQRTMRTRGGERAIAPIGKTWMNGSTLRVRFHRRQRERTGDRARAGRLVGAGLQLEIRLQQRAQRGNPHRLRSERRRLVLRRHRLPQHSRQPADHEPRLSRRRHHRARVRPRHRPRPRAPESARRHPVERASRDRRAGEVAQLLGRGDGPAQRPAQIQHRPDQRHRVRSRLDHALLLSGVMDAQRHRHQGQ